MDKIADALSTKVCFMLFVIIAFGTLFFQRPQGVLAWDMWLSQTVIQLIALNVLARVANKEGRQNRQTLQEELKGIKEAVKLLHSEQKTLRKITDAVCFKDGGIE